MSEPQLIHTAPQIENLPLLLYCPDQGGWQLGFCFGGVWFAVIDRSISLEPSHWMYPPEDPPSPDDERQL
jgi:hypothetical protein